jgi:putative N6-adenine-specific DNA methylase
LFSIPDCQSIVKKAVVERLKSVYKISWFEETGPVHQLQFSILKDQVTIMLDTSGHGLHKRGYRANSNAAPIKETLAAAMCDLARIYPDTKLIDPFCGSGTILIEAVRIALKMPNVNRDFDFLHWQTFDMQIFEDVKNQAESQIITDSNLKVYGYDIDIEQIKLAKYHAKKAGVLEFIRFEKADMRKFKSQTPYGILISNPPYGERLLDEDEVKTLYKDLGKVYRALPNWSGYFLTSFEGFERYFGKSAERKKKISNANLNCSLYSYYGKKPEKTTIDFKK